MKQVSLVKRRIVKVREIIPHLLAMVLLSGYILATSYYAAANFAIGYWSYGLYYGLASIVFLWIFLPHIFHNWCRIYMIASSPDCDYIRLDRLLSRISKVLQTMRCPAARLLGPDLGTLRLYQGRYAEAEHLFISTLQEIERSPSLLRGLPQHAIYECALATAYARQHRLDEAYGELEKAFKRVQKAGAESQMYSIFPLAGRASLNVEKDDLQAAQEDIGGVLSALKGIEPPRGAWRNYAPRLKCTAYLVSAVVYMKMNEVEKANKFFDAIFNTIDQTSDAISPLSVKWINVLAQEYMHKHLYEKAESLFNLSYGLLRHVPDHPDCQQTLSCFRQLLLETNREQEIKDMLAWVRPSFKELPSRAD